MREKEKKDHPIKNGVITMVIGSTTMLFVTTIYNLVLAHIWPVTIHFGEYSLANVVFILVSVLTSILIAYVSFYLAILCIVTWIIRGIQWIGLTPEQRTARKATLLDHFVNGIAVIFLMPFALIGWWQELGKPNEKRVIKQHSEEIPQQQQAKK